MKGNMERREEEWKKNTRKCWEDLRQKHYMDRTTGSLIENI